MMLRRTPLKRGTGLKAKKRLAYRPSTPSPEEKRGRELVARRSGSWCELRAVCHGSPATDWQHRLARSQGGTYAASNGIHCCRLCHSYLHSQPLLAVDNGWTVKRGGNPRAVPVLLFDGLVILGDDGHRYDPPHVAGCPVWESEENNCDCEEAL